MSAIPADHDELRGSAPVFTAKDVLLEVRSDVKSMAKAVDILVSQNLDARVNALERQGWKTVGIAVGISAAVTIIGVLVSVIVGAQKIL